MFFCVGAGVKHSVSKPFASKSNLDKHLPKVRDDYHQQLLFPNFMHNRMRITDIRIYSLTVALVAQVKQALQSDAHMHTSRHWSDAHDSLPVSIVRFPECAAVCVGSENSVFGSKCVCCSFDILVRLQVSLGFDYLLAQSHRNSCCNSVYEVLIAPKSGTLHTIFTHCSTKLTSCCKAGKHLPTALKWILLRLTSFVRLLNLFHTSVPLNHTFLLRLAITNHWFSFSHIFEMCLLYFKISWCALCILCLISIFGSPSCSTHHV